MNAVIYKPRPFVKTDGYFGPDRRRSASKIFKGPYRRSTDAGRDSSDA